VEKLLGKFKIVAKALVPLVLLISVLAGVSLLAVQRFGSIADVFRSLNESELKAARMMSDASLALARFGTVRLLWAGAWTSALAFLPVLLFSELPCALYGARLGQGLALAAFNSAVYVHLDGLSGETRRGELISSFGLTANLAMMSAPPFGQALLDRGGIAWVHGGAFTLALACALTLPRARAGKTFTTALLLWDPRALGPSMCMLGIAASYGALMLSAPLIAEARAIPAGWTFFTAYGLAILATRLGTRRWLDRFERRPFVLTGAVLLGAALVNLSLASNQLGLITSALLFGAGIGIGHPTLMARILETVPPLNRAAATTMGAVAFDGGSALGMLFAGEIAQRISWPAALSGVAGLLGVSLLPLLRSSQPQLGVRP